MLTFVYTALNPTTGQKIKAEIEADNERSAAKLLIDRGLSPLDIVLKKDSPGASFRNRVPTKDRVLFSRQLSTLINAGLPLVQSLNTVREQTKNQALKSIISRLISDVEAGSSLAKAMEKNPTVFNDVYISLVAAGEASGSLDVSLDRLATQQEKDADVISKVRGALIYPAIVIVVLFGIVIFMTTTVLPQVSNLYKSLPGASLPFLTVWLLALSNFIRHFWWLVIILLVVAVYFARRFAKSPRGITLIDRAKIRLPLVGPLFMKLYMARFARTASTLVGAGVPMIKMLTTTGDAIGNSQIKDSVVKAVEQVKGGKTLSSSLENDPRFLDLVPQMISIGEQSGQLESMLGRIADYYEKEVDGQIKAINTIIEPVLMIVVGVIALIIVAAVLLPIYNLAGKNLSSL